MFKEFFVREIRGALGRPMVYIFFLIYAVITCAAVANDNVVIGSAIGNVYKNAPDTVTTFVTVLSLFGLLFAAAFCNNAALRDYSNQFHEILFSTPLSKSGYFFGRFTGAFLLSTLPLLGVYLGVILATLLAPAFGWLDADRLGPIPWEAMLNTYLVFVLPNMLFGGAIIFWLAHRFRSTTISFVSVAVIIMAYLISGTLLSDVDNETIAALTDPFGIRTYSVYSKYFTPIEKNTVSPSYTGLILQNRLIWIGVSLLVTLISYLTFSVRERKAFRLKKVRKESNAKYVPALEVKTKVNPLFNLKTSYLQFVSFFKTSLSSMLKSIVFRILIIICLLIVVSEMVAGFEYFGLQSYPVTYKMVSMITGSSSIFVMIILVFFSGELVWRDRMSHLNEVINATPHHSFSSLAAKTLALISLALILHLFLITLGILYQLSQGYTAIELSVYFGDLLLDVLPGYITYSCLFIFLQVIINNRYLGYFVSVLFLFLLGFIWVALDISTNMVDFNSGPSLFYSDMNGFGSGLTGAIWFNVYWVLFAFLLLLIAGLFMNRNTVNSIGERLKQGRKSFRGTYLLSTLLIFIIWLGTAGFVYYNTFILNDFKTSDTWEQLRVDYEKKYKVYETYSQPKITAVNYFIDIFPESRDVKVRAEISTKNKSGEAIDSLFFNTLDDWDIEIKIPGAEMVLDDEELGFRIYKLQNALDTNASLKVEVLSDYTSRGFENSAGNRSIAANGTFLNNGQILPSLGYQEGQELLDRNDRKKYGLEPKKRIPELQEDCGELCMTNYLSDGASDWVDVETVISTSADQLAIAPGRLIKEWNENGRNYYRYTVDHFSQDFYSFMSARYEKAQRNWQGISLEVYYDKKHPYNVDMMLDAIQKALEYYTQNFGPYYHKQARIIEFPRYQSFAQAFPGTMPYSEALGFIVNLENEDDNNIIDAVIAHEMAHQWWAHQEIPAKMQGGTMLTESFSEYSSLMVMKQDEDDMHMRDFLKYNFDRYLNGRSFERIKEVPLYKVENQGYLHYGKGSLILYALQDYIGEDSVNAALRDFLEEYRYAEPPYPTSLDFLKHLEPRVPDSLQYLVDDWFKKITLYDFRLKEARMRELENGSYAVDMSIEASKIYADTIGNEEKVIPNDWVDIGLYADDDQEELIIVKRVKFNAEVLKFTLTSDQKPLKAAIDPKRLLIERVVDDNVKTIETNTP